ncbi:hypothetical protein [Aeromonas veronii]|uniref:hypothetical protein n=1 Tax=Aeromonas veronii TaxID=654 RepID=UPI003BA05A69
MEQNQQANIENERQSFKISISFVNISAKKELFAFIKRKFNKFYDIERSHLVQGEPFTWGLKVKNIDNKPTPTGKISQFGIRNFESNYFLTTNSDDTRVLPPLNPNDEVIIRMDNDASYVEGALWAYALIEPENNNYEFETYQYNPYHNKHTYNGMDEYNESNWMDNIYIQKKVELLQAKTNNYILILTIISVWESIFGIKKTLIYAWLNIADFIYATAIWMKSLVS